MDVPSESIAKPLSGSRRVAITSERIRRTNADLFKQSPIAVNWRMSAGWAISH
jgi:hypothetical protein